MERVVDVEDATAPNKSTVRDWTGDMPGPFEDSQSTQSDVFLSPSPDPGEGRRLSNFGRSRSKSTATQPDAPGDKAKNELTKVLSLIITRLQERTRPPSIFDQLSPDLTHIAPTRVDLVVESLQSLRAAVRTNAENETSEGAPDEDEDDPTGFSTSETLAMMIQLRDILIMARKQRWNIMPSHSTPQVFESMPTRSPSGHGSSPFKRRQGKTSDKAYAALPSLDLRSSCIAVLAEVVAEDCRYKILSPRLLTPPYALQAVCLDVAVALLEDPPRPHTIAGVAHALIPAFGTFHPALYPRLIACFEIGIVRPMLLRLSAVLGPQNSGWPPGQTLEPSPSIAINVKDVDDQTGGLVSWSAPSPHLLSTFAPHHSADIYRLALFIPPLLAAMIAPLSTRQNSLETVHHASRLFRLLITSKVDSYLDLLQVAAYQSPAGRYGAFALLFQVWPGASGHLTIAAPLTRLMDDPRPESDIVEHEFIPWRYPGPKKGAKSSLDRGVLVEQCQVCSTPLLDFGLRCILCNCGVHFSCYDSPVGTHLTQYTSGSRSGTQAVSVTRFSRRPAHNGNSLQEFQTAGHNFHSVNLFTLTLCMFCHLPLWGCTAQALECSKCQRFAHAQCCGPTTAECSRSPPEISQITIDWSILRKSFIDNFANLLVGEEAIIQASYEDVSIIHGTLWVQQQLMMNGVGSGSIIVDHATSPVRSFAQHGARVEQFELQTHVRLLEAYLASGRNAKSSAVLEHQRSQVSAPEESILHDWPLLTYIVAIVKSTGSPDRPAASIDDTPAQAFEMHSLGAISASLRSELNVNLYAANKLMLEHLHAVGLLQRLGPKESLFTPDGRWDDTLCTFPIPVLLDTSVDVEALVSSIEAGLEDINLSINEAALLLLTRRCWPSIWASDYGLQRLAQALLSWICTEEERLLLVAQEYVVSRKLLPGVRPPGTSPLWPWSLSDRLAYTTSTQSGGEYLSTRKLLLARFVTPWLRELHQLDPEAYVDIVFSYCSQSALTKQNVMEDFFGDNIDLPQVEFSAVVLQWGEDTLRSILKICVASAIFSSFENVFVRWLDVASAKVDMDEIAGYSSLPKLFSMDPDNGGTTDENTPWAVHPWKVINDVASSGQDGLQRAIRWLVVLARSGISIPVTTYSQTVAFIRDFNADLSVYEHLIDCITATCWLGPDNAVELLSLVTSLHDRLRDIIVAEMTGERMRTMARFIRLSLVCCLLLVGFDRDDMVPASLVTPVELGRLPARKRAWALRGLDPSELLLSVDIVDPLSHYILEGSAENCAIITNFLLLLLSPSNHLTVNAVDQFVMLNSHPLAICSWRLYDADLVELAPLRSKLLLRLVVVDPAPLTEVVSTDLQTEHTQLACIARLASLLIDVNSPPFQLEDRSWRKPITSVLNLFFEQLWSEKSEDARHTADIATKGLTEVHKDVLTRCWGESLLQCSVAERVQLVSFLLKLHPFVPEWRLLSWDTVKESMLEDDYSSGGLDADDILAHVIVGNDVAPTNDETVDSQLLRVLLVTLSLDFIGDGITIALKIKHHLARILAFDKIKLIPTSDTIAVYFEGVQPTPSIAQPCLNALLRTLDCGTPISIRPSAMCALVDGDPPTTCAVGNLFVDIVLHAVTGLKLSQLPYLVARGWLEMLIVIILKYEFGNPTIRQLSPRLTDAVRYTTDLFQQDLPDDLRHLAMSVSHAFLHAKPNMCAKILSRQIVAVTTVLADSDAKSDQVLVSLGKSFLDSAFNKFTALGLFRSLFKKDILPADFFDVIREVLHTDAKTRLRIGEEPLQNIVIRSVLTKMFDVRTGEEDQLQDSVRHMADNLLLFVDRVHHENYPESLLSDIAHSLTNVARKTAEWRDDMFVPDPFLNMACTIVQHHKGMSRDLLLHMETLLRASLSRFNVALATLNKTLATTSSLFRRASTINFDIPPNHVALAIVELVLEELRGRNRSTAPTFSAMLKALVVSFDSKHPLFPPDILTKLATTALMFLESHRPYEHYVAANLEPTIAAAQLVLYASPRAGEIMITQLIGSNSGRNNVPVKVWSALSLSSLLQGTSDTSLLVHVPAFGLAYANTVSALTEQPQGILQPNVGPDVSHAYAASKLWILLAQKLGDRESMDEKAGIVNSDAEQRRIWNEIWPSLEQLLNFTILSIDEGSLPILTMIWGCYVDFLSFLQTSGSILATDFAVAHNTTLQRLCGAPQAGSSLHKLSRCISALQNPPAPIPFTSQLEIAKNDFLAAEKLANMFALNGRSELGGIAGNAAIGFTTSDRRRDNRSG
ncbi:hypothetical protein DL93DRAFT_2168963 [Clavulina sp. PMI_390]|nr:hypothetical protein DL93DRAFT_2168963 [Clavulina sp. PMI_390]